ncbi:hypothetical protein C8F04DRAFT_1192401 [Mycena alexandri]|uniref:Uncharacterized protein n=1 Tax=Mycena alexandri TaxID=1745969 RepID=A0AAD6SD38_9AGAR|nr:hypothetical protein C8F04DRAFT_1192401 [Mycena alexandri]
MCRGPLQRHYYSTRLQERPEGNAAKTGREQVWNTENWRFEFIQGANSGPETVPQWLLWEYIKVSVTVQIVPGAAGEFGAVTSMFKPAIPPSSLLYWVGKKGEIILQGLKIAPAEFYVHWVSGMQQNGALFQLGTHSCAYLARNIWKDLN